MLLEPPYRYLFIALVTAVVLAGLKWLGYRTPVRRHGWRRLEPSPMHWLGLILGGGLVILFLYVRLFVGSSRPDAERQMDILTGLIVAFGIGVAISGYLVLRLRRQAFEWRGGWLAWRGDGGERVTRGMDELKSVQRTVFGWIQLTFQNDESVKLDENARGANVLIERLAEQRPGLFPDNPGSGSTH